MNRADRVIEWLIGGRTSSPESIRFIFTLDDGARQQFDARQLAQDTWWHALPPAAVSQLEAWLEICGEGAAVVVQPPLSWCGCNWEPSRTVLFEDGAGVRRELSAGVALDRGLFECSTLTPGWRDVLREWAADPTMLYPDSSRASATPAPSAGGVQ